MARIRLGRRRNRRRQRRQVVSVGNLRRNAANQLQMVPTQVRMARDSAMPRRPRLSGRIRLSKAGEDFLKAVIAPKDFPGLMPAGVPDRFGGKTFVMSHSVVYTMSTTAGQDMAIAFLPTLPTALWYSSLTQNGTPTPTTVWSPHPFPNVASQVFGFTSESTAAQTNALIAGYRILGGVMEIHPQSAPANTPNVVFAVRQAVNLTSVVNPGSGDTTGFAPIGMDGCCIPAVTANANFYQGALANGVYVTMAAADPVWQFRPVMMNQSMCPLTNPTSDGTLNGQVLGFDPTCNSNFVVIPAYTSVQTLVVSVNLLVEYQPAVGTLLEAVATQAPAHDPLALEIYEQFVRGMPVAVPAYQNAGFWKTFLDLLSQSGIFISSFIPGLPGAATKAVATGLGVLSAALE